ncbi:MAG: anthranilate phosphoribosyltransferase [Pseudomonadota bacterium]
MEALGVTDALQQILDGDTLSREEARTLFDQIMSGSLEEAQIAAILMGLAMRGETPAEIAGAAEAMRAHSTKVSTAATPLVDTCGTGGSGQKLFNISTASAFVVAAAGGYVAKHGNRKMTSTSGSADVLEAAGVALDLTPAQIAQCIDDIGVGFLFAPAHHSAMRHAGPVRQKLKVRTVFNVLGPLTNPAGAPNQVIGVYSPERLRPLAEVLKLLDARHVLLVHSAGLDELRLDAPTEVVELRDGNIKEYRVVPEDFGMTTRSIEGLRADDTATSLALLKQSLAEPDSDAAELVSLNAGAAIYAAGIARSFKDGVTMAQDAIAAGLAQERFTEFVRLTQLLSGSDTAT